MTNPHEVPAEGDGSPRGFDDKPGTSDILAGLLDAMPFPSVLLDSKLNVLSANRRAREQFTAECAFLCITDGKLRLSAGVADRHNIGAILEDLQSGRHAETRRVIPLDPEPDGCWLVIERVGATPGTFIASLRCLADLHPTHADSLGKLLRLTPSEASLLCAVVSVGSIAEYAASCGREPSTIRWHMRNLLSKTGCRSQRELNNLALMLII